MCRFAGLHPRFRYRLQGQHVCLIQVKQHYRDVILFFKIGSFYEVTLSALLPTVLRNLAVYAALAQAVHALDCSCPNLVQLYEEDAQIGHDVLGWKLTLTGVGSCRQVGPPACLPLKPRHGSHSSHASSTRGPPFRSAAQPAGSMKLSHGSQRLGTR